MLAELLERQARDRPDSHAIVEAGGAVLTWRHVRDLVEGCAVGLATHSDAERPVGVLLRNGPDFIVALLALARAGRSALALSPDLAAPEIARALATAGCRRLMAGDELAAICRRLDAAGWRGGVHLTTRRDFGLPSLRELAVCGRSGPAVPAADRPFLQLLTSGTTGRPRRVVRTQAALAALARAFTATARLTAEDRVLCIIPLHHGQGLCVGLLAPLASGAATVLAPRFDRRQTLALLADARITVTSAPPFLYSILADTAAAPLPGRGPRLSLTGGAALARPLWEHVRRRLGLELRQSYGASETGLVAMNTDTDPEERVESVGRPLAGVEVAIHDGDGTAPETAGEGEILVRSPAASGWAGALDPLQPGLEALPAGGWIRPGDTGRLDADGRLYVYAQRRGVANAAGRKVSLHEIEAALLEHPAVSAALVELTRDETGNESTRAIVSCTVPCTRTEIVAFCRERLASYKVPRLIEVVRAAADVAPV